MKLQGCLSNHEARQQELHEIACACEEEERGRQALRLEGMREAVTYEARQQGQGRDVRGSLCAW